MKKLLLDWVTGVVAIGAALSVPGIMLAAWWYGDAGLLMWLVFPIILFMAG